MLIKDKYPLTAKYDFKWTKENSLGSNAVLLAESLSRVMDLKPGMRVMDMGCGKAAQLYFPGKGVLVLLYLLLTYGIAHPKIGSVFAKPECKTSLCPSRPMFIAYPLLTIFLTPLFASILLISMVGQKSFCVNIWRIF